MFGIQAKQKWINDIYVDDKKVAGILCETNNAQDGGFEVSVGIGVNLTECPDDCAKLDIDREQLLFKLILSLQNRFSQAD